MKRNTEIEEVITVFFLENWASMFKKMSGATIRTQPISWTNTDDGTETAGYAFCVNGVSIVFIPINYAYTLTLIMRNGSLISCDWSEAPSYISTSSPVSVVKNN